MGVEWELVCWEHHEGFSLGKLREKQEMIKHLMTYPRTKIPKWLKGDTADTLRFIKLFRKRHKGCKLDLINDHMDLEDALFIEVDWCKSIPTKEDFVKYAEEKAVPMFRGDHIEYFVDNFTARDLGAKDRIVKIKRHVKSVKRDLIEEFNMEGKPIMIDMSSEIYEGEDGLFYEMFPSSGGVGVLTKEKVEKL